MFQNIQFHLRDAKAAMIFLFGNDNMPGKFVLQRYIAN
jgi:hypothetical protein